MILYVSATTASFLFGLTPLFVLFLSTLWLQELPTMWQIVGVLISLVGSWSFFASGLNPGEPLGIVIIIVGLWGFALFGVLGRVIARNQQANTDVLTAIPLGSGVMIAIPEPSRAL
ncbi:MAG: EamA family transporter [Desulfobacteraceae bacterium]|nr:EamA family transporter [Desulfobacteraceae bacterium]